MFSPYAFYFPWLLYFLLSEDCSFIRLRFSPCQQRFPQISKKTNGKKILFIFLWFMKLASSAFATVFMQNFVCKSILEALFTSFRDRKVF